MTSYTMPTEQIELPSKGLLYDLQNPLSSGVVEMKYMTAKEEDILTNPNYLKQGTWLDKLLKSLIVSEVNFQDLLLGDKDAIILSARILGYGKDFKFQFYSEHLNEEIEITVDLTLLKEKQVEINPVTINKNEFAFELPHTGNKITFKLLTVADEAIIQKEIAGLKKINPKESFEITARLKHMIQSVNGVHDKKEIRSFVDDAFLAKDAKAFRNYLQTITPGVDLTYTYVHEDGVEEDIQLPVGLNFFWPES